MDVNRLLNPQATSREPAPTSSGYQPSDFSGVTTADLVTLWVSLGKVPATLGVSAVYGRVRAELDRRRTGFNCPVSAAFEAYWDEVGR
jgi:hypothetical protein